MKFRYDINDNYFDVFNESQGIVTFRQEIEKNPYNVDTYTGKCISYMKVVLVLLVISVILNLINTEWFLSKFFLFAFAIICSFVVALIVVFVLSYFQQKKMFHSGEIKFDKNGILDTSDSGIRIGIDWSLVDLVVIKDKVVVLLTKSNFYFHFDESLIDKVLEAVNKYHKDVKIIYVSIVRNIQPAVIVEENTEEVKEETKEVKEEKKDDTEVKFAKIDEIKLNYPSEKLNPISEEVVEMDKDTITEIIVPPFSEYEESTEE